MSGSFRERNRRRRENSRREKEINKEEIEDLMMKPSATYFFNDLEEGSGATVAMEVDDDNHHPLDMMGEAGGVGGFLDNKLVDADFFNSFQDDFDDSDIN